MARLSVRQAAARAGISIWSVYRLINEGHIVAEHPSKGRIVVDAGSLETHLANSRDPEFWASKKGSKSEAIEKLSDRR